MVVLTIFNITITIILIFITFALSCSYFSTSFSIYKESPLNISILNQTNNNTGILNTNIQASPIIEQPLYLIVKNAGNQSLYFPNSYLGLKIYDTKTKVKIPFEIISTPSIYILKSNTSINIPLPLKEIINGKEVSVKPGNYTAIITTIPFYNSPRNSANTTFTIK